MRELLFVIALTPIIVIGFTLMVWWAGVKADNRMVDDRMEHRE